MNIRYTQSKKTSCDASMVSSDTDTRHRHFRCFRLGLPGYARAASSTTRAAVTHEGQWRASSGSHSESRLLNGRRDVYKLFTYLDGTRFRTRKIRLFGMPFLLIELGKR
jgi:hypothetical protein